MAFRSISTTLKLDVKQNPLADAQGKYPKAIQQLLEGYRREDPPAQPKLAVPLTVPQYLLLAAKDQEKQAIADLAIIAFYYLLRVGEYTRHRVKDKRRTKQFRVKDIAFWHNDELLDPNLPEPYLIAHCTAATLSISNQKNGRRAQTIHQEAIHLKHCPVRAVIRRVKHILAHTTNQDTIIGTFFTPTDPEGKSITASKMNKAVKYAVTFLNLDKKGLVPDQVGSHSLRAGGAMAMHLNKVDHNTIKKMGRWSSDTFLMYIHEQIAAFSSGISKQMSNPIVFQNVAFQPARVPTLSPAA